jgi:protein tyrosine phosphatase (PTP) superfamily phosphohydrolase (DUF442 family)
MLYSRGLYALLIVSLPVLAGTAPGIKNFDQVDSHVYRGGQPSNEGIQYLAKLGIRTIVNLREADGQAQAEGQVVTAAGMKYINVPMSGLTAPTADQITKVLDLLEDNKSGPVFVHCMRGADRTGAVIAAYHIDHDNWDNARALKDAKAHKMSVFQLPRQRYILSFRPRVVDAKTSVPADVTKTSVPADATVALPAVATPALKN